MATTYNNAQIGVVDASGNLNVIYPITKARNVAYKSTNVDEQLTSLQSAVDTLNSNLSQYICKKLKVSLTRTVSSNKYTFTGTLPTSTPTLFGLLIIGFISGTTPIGPCDVAIGLCDNVDSHYTYKNISFTTNKISSYSITFFKSGVDRRITVSVESKGAQLGIPSIGYINLV